MNSCKIPSTFRCTLALLVGISWLTPDHDGRLRADDGLGHGETTTHSLINSIDDVSQRFEKPGREIPDFQRHVAPLLGRLGCNGRACHGSFQGRGGFRLSLFGFDFESDLKALHEDGRLRVDLENPQESLILVKPTDGDFHEGGLRYEVDSWQYHLIKAWVENGAVASPETQFIKELIVTPNEIVLANDETDRQLKVVAHWNDGTREDVTPLSRFQTNNPQVAAIDEHGVIHSPAPGDTHVVVFYDNAVAAVPVIHPLPGTEWFGPPKPMKLVSRIDELVQQKLDQIGIAASPPSDDATFLRRVSLDISGTLPTPDEIRQFLADEDPGKRRKKIDELLESPASAAWWTTFFCDLTGNNTRQLQNVVLDGNLASQFWYDWIFDRVQRNVAYDEIVADIIMATSRLPGESYTDYCERMSESFATRDSVPVDDESPMPFYWMRREFQDPKTRAISFAHAFMGVRIQCAQCHKHPFDQWTQDDFQQFSRFFSGVTTTRPQQIARSEREALKKIFEDLGIDPQKTRGGQLRRQLAQAARQGKTVPFAELQVVKPRIANRDQAGNRKQRQRQRHYTDAILLGSEAVDLTPFEDVREPVLKWLRQSDNPYFARSIVNRIWARYFGVGIIEPADDLNLANPPSNGPLLDYLVEGFVTQQYDLRWLHREITNSQTYQLSWETNQTNATDRRNFSHAIPRRLPAEVIYDALRQATANDARNQEFRNSLEGRAIAIAGTNFNQRNRNSPNAGFALQVFGKNTRSSSCDCDRSEDTSLIQTVYLQNDRDIHLMMGDQDGWIRDLAAQFNQNSLTQDESKRLAQAERRLRNLVTALNRARERGDQQQAQKLGRQVRNFEQKLQPWRERRRAEIAMNEIDIDKRQVIEEAYLRTLSRFPNQQEVDHCLEYMNNDDKLVDAMSGVLWALVNTKEFVVNH